jgi:hypothetical protein
LNSFVESFNNQLNVINGKIAVFQNNIEAIENISKEIG